MCQQPSSGVYSQTPKVSTGAFVIVALPGNLNLHSTPQKQQLDLRDIRSLRKYNFFNLTVSALKMTEMSPTWLSSFLWQSSMTSNCITSENLLTHISCKPPLASPTHGKITEIYCLLVLLVWAGEGSGLKGGGWLMVQVGSVQRNGRR